MTGYLSSLASKTASGLKSVASTTASGLGTVATKAKEGGECFVWSNMLLRSAHSLSLDQLNEMLQTCLAVKEKNKCGDTVNGGICEPLDGYIRGRKGIEMYKRGQATVTVQRAARSAADARQQKKNEAAVTVQKEVRKAAALREADALRNQQKKQQIQQEYRKKLVTIHFPKLSKEIAKEISVTILKYRKKPHEACEKSEGDKHQEICAIQRQMSRPYFLGKIYQTKGENENITATNWYGLEAIVKKHAKDIGNAALKAGIPNLYSEIIQKLNEEESRFIKLRWDKIAGRAGEDFARQIINEHADGIAELLQMLSFDQNLLSDIGKDIENFYGIDNLLTHFENCKKTATVNRFSNLGGGRPGGVTAGLLDAIKNRQKLTPPNSRKAMGQNTSGASAQQDIIMEIQNNTKSLRPVQKRGGGTSETTSDQEQFINALQDMKKGLRKVNDQKTKAEAAAANNTNPLKPVQKGGEITSKTTSEQEKENKEANFMSRAKEQNDQLKALGVTRNQEAVARARAARLAGSK